MDSAPVALLLVDIEADLTISDDSGLVVWSEDGFPVAELTCAFSLWLRLPDGERGDFAFDSMSYAEPGAVQITATDEGWRVGSVFTPDTRSAPATWASLAADLAVFIEAVSDEVIALGIKPGFVPGL
ncbi:DUF7878 domain-containing protein [Streptacidiphilus cavernicola]|uniref:DUF7878 domain-containing protein n=1 Tax=Streptacidiphilus cavernicola TaxID=3342716 RepID=A0ABV6VYR0_9ACTN